MIVRSLKEIENTERDVNWGQGMSHRLLLERDGMGFALTVTEIPAGVDITIEYRNHFEACYCYTGSGEISDMGGNTWAIEPGTVYALDQHDKHRLRAFTDLRLVSVFNPPIRGDECHNLDGDDTSSY